MYAREAAIEVLLAAVLSEAAEVQITTVLPEAALVSEAEMKEITEVRPGAEVTTAGITNLRALSGAGILNVRM